MGIEKKREAGLLGVAALFVLVNGVAFCLVDDDWGHLRPLAVWLLAMGGMMGVLWRRVDDGRPGRDPYLLPVYGLLTGWGVLLQARLAPAFIGRHTLWVAIGTILLTCLLLFPRPLAWLGRFRYSLLLGGLILLGMTLIFGQNPTGYGAALWLPVPLLDIWFQPSELLKLLLILFFASYFAERERQISYSSAHGLLAALPWLAPLGLMWGFCVVLLVWQRDLGAATIFFALFVSMLYMANGRVRYVAAGGGLLLTAGVIGYFAFDVVALRVEAWANPWPDFNDRAFQIVQSLYAIAAGGVLGTGIGQGYPTFIPVVHSDFVFAAIAEEWGLIGALTIVVCFGVLAQRGFRAAVAAVTPFATYVISGITVLFAIQALLIMGGVTKLLPLTGVTLPFVSYGGSALLTNCVMLGLLMKMTNDE